MFLFLQTSCGNVSKFGIGSGACWRHAPEEGRRDDFDVSGLIGNGDRHFRGGISTVLGAEGETHAYLVSGY